MNDVSKSDVLREAAIRIRRTLCYGGSAHDFFSGVSDWLYREAGQADREYHLFDAEPIHGEPDPLAVAVAQAFLGVGRED